MITHCCLLFFFGDQPWPSNTWVKSSKKNDRLPPFFFGKKSLSRPQSPKEVDHIGTPGNDVNHRNPTFFPKSNSEMLGFSFRSLLRGARFERSLRVTGAGAAEMAWEEATEGERGVSGRWELLGLELQKWHGKRLRRGSEVWAVAESYWGWSCRNGMGRGYGGGARFERSLGVTGAGAAEMAWEEATEGERGLSGRWELLGLELQKWHGKRLRRGSEVWAVAGRNGMGRG